MGSRGAAGSLLLAAVALGAALCAPAGASAQAVERGRALFLDADFQESARAFDEVLASRGLTRADAVEAARHLTALRLMLGDQEAAARHAAAAAALDPEVTAPEGAPAEAEELLREAGRRGAARLSIAPAAAPRPGASIVVSARLDPAPGALVASIGLRCADTETRGPVPEVSLALETPGEGEALACEAAALTGAGAPLLVARETFSLGDAQAGDGGGGDDAGAAPLWPWIAAGVGAAALATVLVVVLATSGADQARFGATQVEGEGW